jgi:hypothetical protein
MVNGEGGVVEDENYSGIRSLEYQYECRVAGQGVDQGELE